MANRWWSCIGVRGGHYKTKENRAQKLVDQWHALYYKMSQLVRRGHGVTETARCAYGVLLMMETGIRIGNESSAEGFISTNKFSEHHGKLLKTFGLTTLRHEHVTFGVLHGAPVLQLNFTGKKGVENELRTVLPILCEYANYIYAQQYDTFLGIDKYMLYKFVKKRIGRKFSPKDIRTAKVNIEFIKEILLRKHASRNLRTKKDVNAFLSQAVEQVAGRIGHTKAVCRSAYVSKRLLTLYKEALVKQLKERR
jgi:DNA topoisomerase IB